MIDFVNAIISGNLSEILGELYAPTVAAVAASWAILAFAALCQAITNIFLAVFNMSKRGQ